jgi:hypothetical protein
VPRALTLAFAKARREIVAAFAMDRIANHKTQSVTDVYEVEDKRIMAAVARHVISIVDRTGTSNVVALR